MSKYSKRKIYLVKKNPQFDSQDNWLLMSTDEFNAFIKTPQAKGRYFADLGSHEDSREIYIAECSKERAILWRSELNYHYYLKKTEKESGIQTLSLNSIIDNEEIDEAEMLADHDCDVVAEVMQKIEFERLQKALDSLTPAEYGLIYDLYLKPETMTMMEAGKKYNLHFTTIDYHRKKILKKIKNIL